MTRNVILAGTFDQMDFKRFRFIHEASKLGNVDVLLFDDAVSEQLTGSRPKFPFAERMYLVENIRYVKGVFAISDASDLGNVRSLTGSHPDVWISLASDELPASGNAAAKCGIEHQVIYDYLLSNCPEHNFDTSVPSGRKVIVTGCFDLLHTGHVRFFEEASEYGDLYVVLGHDQNLRKLKGPGHPMFSEHQRRYMAGSIRFVKEALVASGHGWLDAEPEIEWLKPDAYVVNEDGDKDVKRQYCRSRGIEYIVLKRQPKPGLQRRTSTDLRGF